MVTTARFSESGLIIAVIDGQELAVPNNLDNRHYRMVAAWELEGGIITPYIAPPQGYLPLPNDIFHAMRDTLGITDATVEAAIVSMTVEGIERNLATRRFHKSTAYHHDNPLFTALAANLGMTQGAIDTAWRDAEQYL